MTASLERPAGEAVTARPPAVRAPASLQRAAVPAIRRLKRGEVPVTLALHPFDIARAETVTAPEGACLAELIAAHVGDPVLRAHLVVELDGVAIGRDDWTDITVTAGASILVRVRPSGDDGNKVLRTILQIAVVAVAAWVGAGGLTFTGIFKSGLAITAAAAATVVVIGNLAINALVPPPQPDLGGTSAPSPTYSVDGARNQALPYQPMPVPFGEHRLYPPLQGVPVQEVVGDDIYLRYLLNLGPMPQAVDPATIKIGETPIGDYAGVEYELRLTPSDPPISLYRDDPFTEAVGTLLDGGAWVSRTTQTLTTEIIAIIAFPQGLGGVDSKGRNTALSAGVEMRYRKAGTADPWVYDRPNAPQSNTAAAGTGYTRFNYFDSELSLTAWQAEVPAESETGVSSYTRSEPGVPWRVVLRSAVPAGQYEVEVRRSTTAVGDSKTKFDRMEWAALRSISARDPMPLANYAYMAVYAKASDQLSGSIDTINMIATRIAPTLSAAIADNPAADLSAVTAADWTGEAASRNPADQALFLYRGGHTAKPRPDDKINWPSWAAFWIWCRDNGYTCDLVIDRPMRRAAAAELICATARARPIKINGLLSVVIDGPRVDGERQLFTPRTSRGFHGRKTFPGTVHALRVVFANREQGYREDEMLVFADGYSELGEAGGGPAGTVAAEYYERFEIRGVTDPDQIWRNARFWMYTALLQTESYEFDVDIESVATLAGDLAAVAHDVMLVGLGQGRVKSLVTDGFGDVTGIVLDEQPDLVGGHFIMEAGKSYGLRWREVVETLPGSGDYRISVAASLALQTIAGAAETLVLAVAAAPADAPKIGQVVAFGEFGLETAPILIKRIRPAPNFGARVEAVAYAPERFEADSGTVPAFNTRITLPRRPVPPTPVLTESYVTADGIFVRFDVGATQSEALSGFRVRWRQQPDTGAVSRFERLPDLAPEERVVSLPPGNPGWSYDVEITTLGANGLTSDPLLVEGLGAEDALDGPTGLSVTPATFTGPAGTAVPGVTLVWDPVEDPRIVDLIVYAKAKDALAADYVQVDTEPPRAGAGEVRGLTPGQALDFGFAYRNARGGVSAPLVEVLDVTVPDTLVATDATAPSAGLAAAAAAVDAARTNLAAAMAELRDRFDPGSADAVSAITTRLAAVDQAAADVLAAAELGDDSIAARITRLEPPSNNLIADTWLKAGGIQNWRDQTGAPAQMVPQGSYSRIRAYLTATGAGAGPKAIYLPRQRVEANEVYEVSGGVYASGVATSLQLKLAIFNTATAETATQTLTVDVTAGARDGSFAVTIPVGGWARFEFEAAASGAGEGAIELEAPIWRLADSGQAAISAAPSTDDASLTFIKDLQAVSDRVAAAQRRLQAANEYAQAEISNIVITQVDGGSALAAALDAAVVRVGALEATATELTAAVAGAVTEAARIARLEVGAVLNRIGDPLFDTAAENWLTDGTPPLLVTESGARLLRLERTASGAGQAGYVEHIPAIRVASGQRVEWSPRIRLDGVASSASLRARFTDLDDVDISTLTGDSVTGAGWQEGLTFFLAPADGYIRPRIALIASGAGAASLDFDEPQIIGALDDQTARTPFSRARSPQAAELLELRRVATREIEARNRAVLSVGHASARIEEVNTLRETGDAVQAAISGLLDVRVTASEGDITAAQGSIGSLQSVTAALDASKVEGTVFNALEVIVTGHTSDIAGAEGDIVTLQGGVASLTTAVANLDTGKVNVSDFNALSVSVSTNAADIAGAEGDIVTLQGSVSTLTTAVADLDAGKVNVSDFNALSVSVSTNAGAIAGAEGDILTLQGSVSTLTTLLADLDANKVEVSIFNLLSADVGANSAAVATNAGAIATLEGAAAFWEVLVAAGAAPAVVRLLAGLGGSEIQLAATRLLLANITGGAGASLVASVMEAIGGYAFFSRPIHINGVSKRLIIGPGTGWLIWFGALAETADTATVANSEFALAADGTLYVYGRPLGSSSFVNSVDTDRTLALTTAVELATLTGLGLKAGAEVDLDVRFGVASIFGTATNIQFYNSLGSTDLDIYFRIYRDKGGANEALLWEDLAQGSLAPTINFTRTQIASYAIAGLIDTVPANGDFQYSIWVESQRSDTAAASACQIGWSNLIRTLRGTERRQ